MPMTDVCTNNKGIHVKKGFYPPILLALLVVGLSMPVRASGADSMTVSQ